MDDEKDETAREQKQRKFTIIEGTVKVAESKRSTSWTTRLSAVLFVT